MIKITPLLPGMVFLLYEQVDVSLILNFPQMPGLYNDIKGLVSYSYNRKKKCGRQPATF